MVPKGQKYPPTFSDLLTNSANLVCERKSGRGRNKKSWKKDHCKAKGKCYWLENTYHPLSQLLLLWYIVAGWKKMYKPGQPNWEYTRWKFQDFSASQILSEINFWNFEAPKNCRFIWAAPNVEFLGIFDILKCQIPKNSKF